MNASKPYSQFSDYEEVFEVQSVVLPGFEMDSDEVFED